MDHNQLFSLSSPEIDQYFGLEIKRIEEQLYFEARALRPQGNLENLGHVLHHGHQTWVGLEPETLNTPYQELVLLSQLLNPQPGDTVVDLGAGYGRLGLVLHLLYPEVHFIGYELVKERVDEGNRIFSKLGCLRSKLVAQDLTAADFELPEAKFYFLYDYGKVHHIRQTMKQLEDMTSKIKFKVVARGKGSRSIIEYEHPWLSQVFDVHYEENFSIYSMSL